jgi:hypothetical protein
MSGADFFRATEVPSNERAEQAVLSPISRRLVTTLTLSAREVTAVLHTRARHALTNSR